MRGASAPALHPPDENTVMNRPARAALAVAGALTLAATLTSCSGENSEYRDAHELRDALFAAGVVCDGRTSEGFAEGEWDDAQIEAEVPITRFYCGTDTVGSPAVSAIVVMGEDASDLHTQVLEARKPLDEQTALIVDANWTVEAGYITDGDYDATVTWLEDIAEGVDGRVLTNEDDLS